MKALSLGIPGHGGMYSAMLTLRQALALYGFELRWAAAGRAVAQQALGAASAEDLAVGSLLATNTDDDEARARALLDHIEHERPAFVLVNVFGGPLETNLVRYLPQDVRRILIVHSISRSTYRAARSVRDWTDAAVAVSPRIRQDLIRSHGFRPESVHLIPNSVAPGPGASRFRGRGGELRVLSHGRVEHSSKGVNWLPEIVQRAIDGGANVSFTVSGEGPDLARLRAQVAAGPLARRTKFLGFVERERVPDLMRAHDVLLLPSVYEGLSLTLLEAMAAGCVPVASRIRGVTDYVIADGETGLLFPVGNVRAAAARLTELGRSPSRLEAMSQAARRAARTRFGIGSQGAAFFSLIQRILREPRRLNAPLPIERWRLPSELRPGWWHALPTPVKDLLRITRERLQFGNA
jgi:glycosyltransferase involved in cell wall biosynthesis